MLLILIPAAFPFYATSGKEPYMLIRPPCLPGLG
jgi:hypothetical protein